MQVICGQNDPCGFRVHDRYYSQKKDRFSPRSCARCGGTILIVDDDTNTVVAGAVMLDDGAVEVS
jgi:hypothetical protein